MAREADGGIEIKYVVPKEVSILTFDMLAIPNDATHPECAYAFMNFMMAPRVIADVSNFKRFAHANLAALPLVLQTIRDDRAFTRHPSCAKSYL